MRIIAGELKGRRLATPFDETVRPTTDKVKEAVFSMIAAYLYDSVVIDMFSGTGNLGLEAISRGASRVYFVDKDKKSISLIKDNIKTCKVEEKSVILCYDYKIAIQKIHDKADIIFLDPPYKAGYLENCISMIHEHELLNSDGILVVEHSSSEELPEEMSGYVMIKHKKYGKICISIFEKQEAL